MPAFSDTIVAGIPALDGVPRVDGVLSVPCVHTVAGALTVNCLPDATFFTCIRHPCCPLTISFSSFIMFQGFYMYTCMYV
jgi:hypothetical protein